MTGFAWDADYLYFTVREPFPTKKTGASLVFGRVTALISLDHDLNTMPGVTTDPGAGLDAAQCLGDFKREGRG